MASIPLCTFILVAIVVLLRTPAATPRSVPTRGGDDVMLQRYERWIIEYNRQYTTEAEKAARFEIFKSNVGFIESFNRNGTRKFKLGINEFTDLTNEEFNLMISSKAELPEPKTSTGFRYENMTDIPESVNWRERGAVTDVKNQVTCGACWVFASVATVESINQIKTGKLVSLSEQQILDCVGGNACQGDNAKIAYDYIIGNKGLALAQDYPYVARDSDVCDAAKANVAVATITGYELVPTLNEGALMRAVANQPVYVLIYAGSPEFSSFAGNGVFHGNCGATTHTLQVIGYGAEADGTKYWLVKNSWGTSWGEGGFGKIARGTGGQGVCSILLQPVYPTLD